MTPKAVSRSNNWRPWPLAKIESCAPRCLGSFGVMISKAHFLDFCAKHLQSKSQISGKDVSFDLCAPCLPVQKFQVPLNALPSPIQARCSTASLQHPGLGQSQVPSETELLCCAPTNLQNEVIPCCKHAFMYKHTRNASW